MPKKKSDTYRVDRRRQWGRLRPRVFRGMCRTQTPCACPLVTITARPAGVQFAASCCLLACGPVVCLAVAIAAVNDANALLMSRVGRCRLIPDHGCQKRSASTGGGSGIASNAAARTGNIEQRKDLGRASTPTCAIAWFWRPWCSSCCPTMPLPWYSSGRPPAQCGLWLDELAALASPPQSPVQFTSTRMDREGWPGRRGPTGARKVRSRPAPDRHAGRCFCEYRL